jgi:hypothetical protein
LAQSRSSGGGVGRRMKVEVSARDLFVHRLVTNSHPDPNEQPRKKFAEYARENAAQYCE